MWGILRVWISWLKMPVISVSYMHSSLIGSNQRLHNIQKPAAVSLKHNLETMHGSLTCFGSSWVHWAFCLKTLTVWLPQQTDWAPLLFFFFQRYHTVLLCQVSDMLKGTTAVFIVLVVVPVAFVQQCLFSTMSSPASLIFNSVEQMYLFLISKARRWPEKIDSWPGIFLCLVFIS